MLTKCMLTAAAAATFACGIAQANATSVNPAQPGDGKMAVGIGVICNTTEQAQDYVKLRSGGAEITLAVSTVNESAQDPRACGVAAVAFERGRTVETVNQNGRLVSIVRVRIMAGFDGAKWARVPDTVQYAIIENEGIDV